MKKLISSLVVGGLLVAAYFLLRSHVVWLDGFDGTVLVKIETEVPTVGKDGGRKISRYALDVETDSGRLVRVPVDQLTYFDAGEGVRVHKTPFSSDLEIKSP